jgi:hypothetical protein
MQERQILDVSQGVWIDERWLHKAGLGSRVQVEMKPGEIRIQAASETIGDFNPSEKGWETFQSLGNNALLGCLENAAEDHDHYLYGKQT